MAADGSISTPVRGVRFHVRVGGSEVGANGSCLINLLYSPSPLPQFPAYEHSGVHTGRAGGRGQRGEESLTGSPFPDPDGGILRGAGHEDSDPVQLVTRNITLEGLQTHITEDGQPGEAAPFILNSPELPYF
ncbi:hypothetical protein SKAU_G00263150 [Synaphobranchus kaupii]|uniref:Uncharacterized protein n=1 Tax=Synaphobranchus kaupii TaxID=118154 RepID=A0A9Q1EZ26_SYNKA|nr:hypothetical protein SKAU_G00263150 [Synaphobranchus kaupii]